MESLRTAMHPLRSITPPDVNPSTVRASVHALLDEPAHRAGARRLQREIVAMPGPAEAVYLIEEVAA